MIRSKNHSGFTLIEVMLALIIVASVGTIIFGIQWQALQAVTRKAQQLHRIFYAKYFMGQARQLLEKSDDPRNYALEQKQKNPETYLRYTMEPVNKDSTLSKQKDVYKETIAIKSSPTGFATNLVSFFYITEHQP